MRKVVFDKSIEKYPVKKDWLFVTHCGVSPFYGEAADEAIRLIDLQTREGGAHFMDIYPAILREFKEEAAKLLHTSSDNIAFVKNTSEAFSMLANGYPFEAGDEIISYIHEYPANHYPWRLQEFKGVKLKLLPNHTCHPDIPASLPGKWLLDDLESAITTKTKVFAISHAQFTSGFACDLHEIGVLCKSKGIDFVVDVAQSLGSLPLDPEAMHISALASAGWKWLMGPFGAGVFFTQPDFREKIKPTQIGAETMKQGTEFLNHSWDLHETAKRFEYSSSPYCLASALKICLKNIHNHYGMVAIQEEIFRLQDVFKGHFHNDNFVLIDHPIKNRSGILAMYHPDPQNVVDTLKQKSIISSTRGGYIRLAPHIHNTDKEMIYLANLLNNY